VKVTYLPTDDVRYLHLMIVHNARKMVRWVAITLQQHLVVDGIVTKPHVAQHHVMQHRRASGHL
jgi:hypothetical protein